MRFCVVVLGVLAGCLDTPPPLGACSPAAVGAPMGSFPAGLPSPPTTIGVTAADLHCNGRTDLVVQSAAAADDRLVFLAGRAPVASGWDAQLVTDEPPQAVGFADVVGSPLPDLLVFGAGGGMTALSLHEASGPFVYARPPLPERAPAVMLPMMDCGPGFVANGVAQANGSRLLVGGNACGAAVVAVPGRSGGAFAAAKVTLLESCPGAAYSAAALVRADDEVFVAGDNCVSSYRADHGFVPTHYGNDASLHVAHSAWFDFDGDGTPELVGQFGASISVVFLRDPPLVRSYTIPGPALPNGTLSALALTDLDGQGPPDVVLLDTQGTNGATNLVVLQDLDPSGATLQAIVRDSHALPLAAAFISAADFDGDGKSEVLVVRADGAHCCLRYSGPTGDPLALCPGTTCS